MAGLKTERQLRDEIGRKLSRIYAEEIAGAAGGAEADADGEWPLTFSLGRPTRRDILQGFDAIDKITQVLRAWEQSLHVRVDYEMREAGGPKRIPVRIAVPSIDVAARLATPRKGEPWTTIMERTRARHAMLAQKFPDLAPHTYAKVLRAEDACSDLEFELLLRAGGWFGSHDSQGLMPRQVPIGGIDSKWLNNARRRALICLLADKDDLGLAKRPAMVEFAYLDPTHLDHGGRRYDSWTQGDAVQVAYVPTLVVIVENKDTYLGFPQVDGGICVFGSGFAGAAIVSSLPWVLATGRVVYWGDLDADGFEILNAYRAAGISCESILMDVATLERYGQFGTNVEKDHHTPLVRQRKDLPLLSAGERAAYELITSESYAGFRRLEQERIPLDEALRALCP